MNDLDKELLKTINGNFEYKGAYNVRKNGESIGRNITEFTNIISKENKSGLDIYVKEDAYNEVIDIPVLIKNPVNPDLELWIGGIQRIYNAGIRRIGAIHRGFSVYGKHIYRNQPQWHLPIELHRRFPDLSIIHDPSHVGGKREFVSTLSQQALDLGFDGLMVETHDNPDCALSDKDQQITPKALFEILSKLVYRKKDQTNEILNQLRQQIDEYDYELIELLAKRMSVCREIGEYKKEKAISIVQNKRYDEIMSSRVLRANRFVK